MAILRNIISIISTVLKWILLLPVFFYKCCISPFLPKMCRFEPTCSTFMVEAVRKKGPIWGFILGVYRIMRCNPFNPGGYDPVERWPPYWTGKKWVWKIPKELEEKLDDDELNLKLKLLEKYEFTHSNDEKSEDVKNENDN